MKERFRSCNFRDESLALIVQANTIVNDYLRQGLRLTLRQLYYQFVVRNLITNEERSYKRLSSLISDARLAGLIDWDAIEDRIRQPVIPQDFTDLSQLVDVALRSYKLDRWEGQDEYVELWVEKDALAGVLAPLGREHHVTIMVNRGYSSQSAMYESANRFREQKDNGKMCVLFYLGDHDPSGEDMVRDIRDRFEMFDVEVEVTKIALNIDQVRQYNPPPNPAKISDPRAKDYIRKFGNQSWEVDALPPNVLQQLIRDAIVGLIDADKLEDIKSREENDKDRLRSALESLEEE